MGGVRRTRSLRGRSRGEGICISGFLADGR